MGKIMYRILINLKICKPVIRSFDVKHLQSVITTTPMIIGSVDQERRKHKALKDLSERLAKTEEQDLLPWDEQAADLNSVEDPTASPLPETQNNMAKKASDLLESQAASAINT